MIDYIPGTRKLNRKNAFYSLILAPLEYVTQSLRRGDEWELADLQDVARRCRALADAFDARIKLGEENDNDKR